jgi:hypothetical protein
MRHSLRTGLSFGLTSGVITTLGIAGVTVTHYLGEWIRDRFS